MKKMKRIEGCPGSQTLDLRDDEEKTETTGNIGSQLRQWPIQMHLISPTAPYFQGADVLLVADCVAYALGGFHSEHLKGKAIGIACPKLDSGQESYVEKVSAMIDEAKINTLTVMIMQVPCCRGLLSIARAALQKSTRKVPLKVMVVGVSGEILQEEWVTA
jgi:hypothetical protein